jgi:Fur family ferric uptake transcriptional regulator
MNTQDILRERGLSVTEGRMRILSMFLDAPGALAHADIEREAGTALDRATVYRTLQAFVGKGLIHQIPTTDNSILYALCRQKCNHEHHEDDHVHFICDVCQKTMCLDEVTVPRVRLPRGFKPHRSAMVVTGVCRECRQ